MRVLIYSQDGTGLGHLRRAVNIASELLTKQSNCNILILSDSPAAPLGTSLPRGIDYMKLPTIVKKASESWESAAWETSTLPLHVRDTVNLRAQIILQVFSAFVPDAVLVDHMPVGALGELRPMLDAAIRRATRPRLLLGLRDILDAPDVIRTAWTRLGAYDYLSHYDGVLIYGCRDIYDAESAYGLTSRVQQVVYCNYVGPSMAGASADGSAEALDVLGGACPHACPFYAHEAPVPQDPVVLVMGGGGADAFRLAKVYAEALPIVLQQVRLKTILLTGPNMPSAERSLLSALCASYPVKLQRVCDDVTTLLRRAAMVVTMAGYNSLCEVLATNTKALVVPRGGPSAEQRMRTALFAKRGLIRSLSPSNLTPDRLAGALLRVLADRAVPDHRKVPPLDGAQQTVKFLLNRGATAEERRGASVPPPAQVAAAL